MSEFYVRKNYSILPACTAYEDGTECSETSAYKINTPGNHTKEIIQHLEQGKSLKSRIISIYSPQGYNMEVMLVHKVTTWRLCWPNHTANIVCTLLCRPYYFSESSSLNFMFEEVPKVQKHLHSTYRAVSIQPKVGKLNGGR
jgi:hypothetical protein